MALCEPAAHPFHDTMKSLHTSSVFHQDDLWTACGGYEGSDDELSSMVSMVTSLQCNHHHPETFTSGLHRNASFDSGSTSRDSCTPSFSTGSPVTVLPPLPYSCSDGKDQESYTHYVDGLWTAHDRASDCDQMLASPGGENFPSLLMNELPLRSYGDGVDQVCGSSDIDYHLECMVTSSVSSHPGSYQTSDNSRSTPESDSHTGIQSNFCQEFLLGHEYGSDNNRNQPGHAVGAPVNRSVSPPRTNTAAAPVHVESEVSPTARRRLSWTDHYWPASGTNPTVTPALLNNFHSTTASQRLQLPQQFVNGFNTSATKPTPSFNDADYAATCNQYRKTQLQEITNTGGAAPINLKRPYSAMQSTCTNVTSPSAAAAASHSFLKFGAATNKQQDAAALSALLYKNNHGSDLIQQLQTGSSCSSGVSAAGGTGESMPPPPKLRRRHGTATDPQSIAARTRRERFSDRIRLLQSLVPNGERLDTVSMLGHTLEYVRFLQHQVWQLYNGSDDASVSQPDEESLEKWKEFMDTQTIMS